MKILKVIGTFVIAFYICTALPVMLMGILNAIFPNWLTLENILSIDGIVRKIFFILAIWFVVTRKWVMQKLVNNRNKNKNKNYR